MAMGLKHRTFAPKSLNVTSASLLEILANIVGKVATITEPAFSGRKLGVEGSAVAKAKGVVELAKVTLCVLALLLLVLLVFLPLTPLAVVILALIVCSATRLGCIIIIHSIC
ncbi:hypothetical protein FPOAC2_00756 [Fusarium poae]